MKLVEYYLCWLPLWGRGFSYLISPEQAANQWSRRSMSRDGWYSRTAQQLWKAVWQTIAVALLGNNDSTHLKDLKQKYNSKQRRARPTTRAVIRFMLLCHHCGEWTRTGWLWEHNIVSHAGCFLTQLFFFFFLASWSFRLPMLDILVRLLRLEMLSHEFWRRICRSGKQETTTLRDRQTCRETGRTQKDLQVNLQTFCVIWVV